MVFKYFSKGGGHDGETYFNPSSGRLSNRITVTNYYNIY